MTIIIIIIIIIIIAFIEGIYNSIPETNHVSTVYNITDILRLQIVVDVTVFFTKSLSTNFTYRSTCAIPNVAAVCSYLLYFSGVLLRYFLNDLLVVAVVPTL